MSDSVTAGNDYRSPELPLCGVRTPATRGRHPRGRSRAVGSVVEASCSKSPLLGRHSTAPRSVSLRAVDAPRGDLEGDHPTAAAWSTSPARIPPLWRAVGSNVLQVSAPTADSAQRLPGGGDLSASA